MVVGVKIESVGRLQAVARVNDALAILHGLGPARGPGVDLGVQIHFSAECPEGTLVCATVFVRTGRDQAWLDGVQFVHDPVKEVRAHNLLGRLRTRTNAFVGKRNVSEQIQCVVVAQGAQVSSLCIHFANRQFIGLAKILGGQVGFTRVANELIGQADLVVDAVVHGTNKGRVIIPLHCIKLGDTRVGPSANRLVGGQLLQVPHDAHVLRKAFIKSAHIGHARRAVVARNRQPSVNLRKNVGVVVGVAVDLFRRQAILGRKV